MRLYIDPYSAFVASHFEKKHDISEVGDDKGNAGGVGSKTSQGTMS